MSALAQTHEVSSNLRPGDVDLSDPKTFLAGVPHEYCRVLREQDPVQRQEECRIPVFLPGPGYWALTRYEDVAFVSMPPELFSSAVGSSVLNELRPYERRLAREQLIQMDPTGHTELRGLMNAPFKPHAVRATEAHVRRIVCGTLDRLEGRSACDFVGEVSAPISLRVLTNFLGVPDEYTARFYRWINETMRFAEPGSFNLLRARFALAQIFVQSALLAREPKKRPTTDVFSRLVSGRFQRAPLSRVMTQGNFFLLIIAGNETTRNAVSGGIQALCDQPEQLDRLRREPSLLAQAIGEILRWVSSGMGRLAAQRMADAGAKAAVYESANLPFASLLDFEGRNQRAVSRSEDVKEGIGAFLERRKPEFRGR
jgi:cholest-4-en-3-one 26-monooxygenase